MTVRHERSNVHELLKSRRLHAVETKAFQIIGISHDEAESLGLSLSHRRQVGGLSVFYRLLFGLAPLLSLQYVPTIFPQDAKGPLRSRSTVIHLHLWKHRLW